MTSGFPWHWEVLCFERVPLGTVATDAVHPGLSGSFQPFSIFVHALKQSSKPQKTVLAKMIKSMGSASFAVLMLVNYSAASCNLFERWSQLNSKRANLKRRYFTSCAR